MEMISFGLFDYLLEWRAGETHEAVPTVKIEDELFGYSVWRNEHLDNARSGEKSSRVEGLSDTELKYYITKAFRKLGSFPHGVLHIIHRNSNGNFDDQIIFVDNKAKQINIKTYIKNRRAPKDFKSKQWDTRVILENQEHFFVFLDDED